MWNGPERSDFIKSFSESPHISRRPIGIPSWPREPITLRELLLALPFFIFLLTWESLTGKLGSSTVAQRMSSRCFLDFLTLLVIWYVFWHANSILLLRFFNLIRIMCRFFKQVVTIIGERKSIVTLYFLFLLLFFLLFVVVEVRRKFGWRLGLAAFSFSLDLWLRKFSIV